MELGARVVPRPTVPGTETVSAGFCARRPGGSSGRNGGVRGEAAGAGARRPSRRALGSLLPGFRQQREPCAQRRPPRRPRGSEPRGGRRAGGLSRDRAGGAASAAPMVPRRRKGTEAGSLGVQTGQARYSVREAQAFLRLRAAAAAAAPARPGSPQPRSRPAPAGEGPWGAGARGGTGGGAVSGEAARGAARRGPSGSGRLALGDARGNLHAQREGRVARPLSGL